jgi:LysM repeat protein
MGMTKGFIKAIGSATALVLVAVLAVSVYHARNHNPAKQVAKTIVVNEATEKTTDQPERYPERYTVDDGDTLWWITDAACNDASRWTEVQSLSDIADPKKIRKGDTLSFPVDCHLPAGFTPHRMAWHQTAETASFLAQSAPKTSGQAVINPPAPLLTAAPISAPATLHVAPPLPEAPVSVSTASPAEPASAVSAEAAAQLQPQATHETVKPGFYNVRLTAEQQKLYPAIQAGKFFALELANQQEKGSWKGYWKTRRNTHVTVTRNDDGTTDVGLELHAPTNNTLVAFVSGDENIMLPSAVILNQGAPTRGSPKPGIDLEEKKHRKVLISNFRKEPNLLVRDLMKFGIPAVRTGVGFAFGGPVGALLVNVPDALGRVTRHLAQPIAVPQQEEEVSLAETSTAAQPQQQ